MARLLCARQNLLPTRLFTWCPEEVFGSLARNSRPSAVVIAAARAQKAADYILGLLQQEQEDDREQDEAA